MNIGRQWCQAVRPKMVLMTIESHLLNQQYNDLGFMVRDRLLILVEHQSTWSENIVVRVLLYVVETWNKYIKQKELDVYDKDKITLPKPELYVIYTGQNPEDKPDVLSMRMRSLMLQTLTWTVR